jgi:hypothetical protein
LSLLLTIRAGRGSVFRGYHAVTRRRELRLRRPPADAGKRRRPRWLVEGLNLLVETGANDALTFLAPAALIGVVLFAASWSPARRAASTDPATALRDE